jgi:hypothetical protein
LSTARTAHRHHAGRALVGGSAAVLLRARLRAQRLRPRQALAPLRTAMWAGCLP